MQYPCNLNLYVCMQYPCNLLTVPEISGTVDNATLFLGCTSLQGCCPQECVAPCCVGVVSKCGLLSLKSMGNYSVSQLVVQVCKLAPEGHKLVCTGRVVQVCKLAPDGHKLACMGKLSPPPPPPPPPAS